MSSRKSKLLLNNYSGNRQTTQKKQQVRNWAFHHTFVQKRAEEQKKSSKHFNTLKVNAYCYENGKKSRY